MTTFVYPPVKLTSDGISFYDNDSLTFVRNDDALAINNFPLPSGMMIKKDDGNWYPVTLDTSSPYNHTPIPVCITDVTGTTNVTINAGDIAVGIKHNGADPSSVRIGDGTNLATVSASNALKVDASATTQPISNASLNVDTAASGSITGTASAQIATTNYGSVAFTVNGTWTGTITVELSQDNSTWYPTSYVALASGNSSNTFTANTAGQINVVGFAYCRLKGATVSSGTAFVNFIASNKVSNVMLDNPLPAGSNNIGNINNITGTVALPTLAATSTLQTTGNNSLALIDSGLSDGSQKSQIVDASGNVATLSSVGGLYSQNVAQAGTVFFFSTNNSTTAQLAASATFTGTIESTQDQQAISMLLTCDQNGTLTLNQYIDAAGLRKTNSWTYNIVAGVPFSRSFVANGNYFNLTFQNTGGSTTTTLNINTAFGTIPNATNLGNTAISLDEMSGTSLTVGQKSAATSIPVTLSNENVLDMTITGQSAQTATVNNILTAASGASATDLSGYRSAMVQVVSTGTAGTFIFEGSNDNVSFITIPVYNQLILTGTPITAAITATASQIGYVFATNFRYVRLRIATTITGGSIQAFSKFSQSPFTPAVFTVSQGTAANLNATIASPVIAAGANVIGNVGVGVVSVVDQASAAITTTTTGAAKLITNGSSVSFTVNATVVSGTTPTYDFKVQESNDGTIWTDVWAAQRLTAVSSITTPALRIRGNQYRYVETISGTTPSFTRVITSARIPHMGELIRNIVDRTIAPITTNSVTPTLYSEGASFITMTVAQGAGGSAVVFAIDGSMDGTNWVQGIKTLTGVVSGFVSGSVSASFKFLRARVVTGVAATTITYLELEAKETPVDVSVNQNGSSSGTTSLTTVVTLSPPIGAVGFILQCDGASTNVNGMRFRVSGVATASSGVVLAPGQDTGFVPCATPLSLCSMSGTSAYNLEWILK